MRVVAPEATEELQRLAAQGTVQWERRPAGADIVITYFAKEAAKWLEG